MMRRAMLVLLGLAVAVAPPASAYTQVIAMISKGQLLDNRHHCVTLEAERAA